MRYNSLHALRGLAALSVVFYHLFLTFPEAIEPINLARLSSWMQPETWLRYTPLRALVNGRSAVILFFVLSGFVLAKSVTGGKESFGRYAFRRVCRIYLPFAAAIGFAAVLCELSTPGSVAGLSRWFNEESWVEPVSAEVLFQHLAMTGRGDQMHLNNVMWSLVHELRISLIFPVIAFFVTYSLRVSLVSFLTIWVISTTLGYFLQAGSVASSVADTFGYAFFFALGAACYLYKADFIAMAARWNTYLVIGLSVIFMAVPAGVLGAELLYGFASIGLIGISLSKAKVRSILEIKSNLWLGEISYSLYLCHLPILLFAFNRFYGQIGTVWIAVGAVLASLVIAQIMYFLIERPSMALGKAYSRRVPA